LRDGKGERERESIVLISGGSALPGEGKKYEEITTQQVPAWKRGMDSTGKSTRGGEKRGRGRALLVGLRTKLLAR